MHAICVPMADLFKNGQPLYLTVLLLLVVSSCLSIAIRSPDRFKTLKNDKTFSLDSLI